jgi:hypothetical protein
VGRDFLENSSPKQRLCAASVRQILTYLHDLKYIVSAAGVLIAFMFDKKLGPAEDDLPMRFRILLAAPVIVAVFYSISLSNDQKLRILPYICFMFIIVLVTYSILWSVLGYKKQIDIPRPWWKPLGRPYKQKWTRVMGGKLKNEAKATIERENITAQDYFEGTAYDQDRVWNRPSRALAQAGLVITYIAVAVFYTLTIAMTLS